MQQEKYTFIFRKNRRENEHAFQKKKKENSEAQN